MYQKTFCANPACAKHSVYSGGQFLYSAEQRAFFCSDCFYDGSRLPNNAKSAFEFTTTAITGKPIHVKGINDLQRLEKEHGCSSVVLNCDRSNWSSPKQPRENWQQPVAPMRGIEAGIGRPQEGRR